MNSDRIEHYVMPETLLQAVELLGRGPVTIIAGGTDVMPQTRSGRLQWQATLVNIRRLAELRGLREQDGTLVIGALTTVTSLLRHAAVQQRLGVLHQACDAFASDQIRNVATVGGNLCNASPASDLAVPLLALGAEVELARAEAGTLVTRRLPLAGFFTGPGRTQRAEGELLTAIHVPLPTATARGQFLKFGTRPALDISTISIAVSACLADGCWRDVRIALGAVAPAPLRALEVEAALEGAVAGPEAITAAVQAVDATIRPIDDVRASGWYRRELVHNLLRRVLESVSQH